MAESSQNPTEDLNRSFEGFDEDEEREENIAGEGSSDGARRRYFSKVSFVRTNLCWRRCISKI